jgi:hypothetical protein
VQDFQIYFELRRYAEGYELVPDKSSQPESPPGQMIEPRGRALIPSPPFEKFDTLYRVFADVRTQDDLIAFVNRFGLLSTSSDSIFEMLREAQFFRDLLSCKRRSQKAVAACFESQRRVKLAATYEKVNVKLPPNAEMWEWQMMVGNLVGLDDIHQFVGRVELVPDPVKGIQMRITTHTLIGALWWQLARKLSGEAKIRQCRHCGEWFEAGTGAARRADAEFCSKGHKVRFFSLRRTRGGSNASSDRPHP